MYNILFNAQFGGGCFAKNPLKTRYMLRFSSTSINVVTAKKAMCIQQGFKPSGIGESKQMGFGTKEIYQFATRLDDRIMGFINSGRLNALSNMTKEDLALWYLDDGSYHQNKHFGHLYCNTLDREEMDTLSDRILELYGIAPRDRMDRKKDGREYPYFYFGVELMKMLKKDVRNLIDEYGLYDMSYKIGETFNDYPERE